MPPPQSLSPEDRLDIAGLAHAYAAGVDDRSPDTVADLFTADGVLVTAPHPDRGGPRRPTRDVTPCARRCPRSRGSTSPSTRSSAR
ncbi:nuclear transport factor 2 family protein [Nocardioides sambongensis]|uniref:nuclear transport factor 2 family protein n=1 Tax=Nocardioides sambongensis TaxID=2589074 RepID=UPI001129FA68|nr:nuclear transport factor 2 family protein [Nocardioides sambongensis]